jgi:hypothetical protein
MRSAIFTLTFILASVFAAIGGGDDAPKIQALIKPDKATVGEPLTYQVTFVGKGLGNISVVPPGEREFYPEKKKSKRMKSDDADSAQVDPSQFVPLYVISSIKKDDRSKDKLTDITVTLQIAFYRPGKYALPEIEFKGADWMNIGYRIPIVEILSVNEKGEFQEIEPPLELGGNYIRLIFLIIGIIAAAVAGFFAYRRIKKLRDEKKSSPIVTPPIDVFLSEIGAFRGDELIDEGRIEEFVFGISMIFRKYLSLQFGFDAADMTTYEIEIRLRRMFTKSMRDSHFDNIMDSLNLWDLSKFAEFAPSRDILHANLEKTVKLSKDIAKDLNNVAP